jgi:hypothetical protein
MPFERKQEAFLIKFLVNELATRPTASARCIFDERYFTLHGARTALRHIPEDYKLHTHGCETVKSGMLLFINSWFVSQTSL